MGIENKLPVAHEGLPFIILPLLLALGVYPLVWWLSLIFLAGGLFSAWFFRDPKRTPPGDDSAVVSPADGTVIKIEEIEEKQFLGETVTKVSIFMSVLNVHVNRAPLSGRIKKAEYFAGKFFSANLDKASKENERNAIVLQPPNRERILFIQVAGLIARRIVCWIMPGDDVIRGQRFGMIRFGSRVELFLPTRSRINIKPGQKLRAGETIVAYLSVMDEEEAN